MQTGLLKETPSSENVAVITGANGFIGRWLALELTRRGTKVVALLRRAQTRGPELRAWVSERGGRGELIEAFDFDLFDEGLGLDESGLAHLQSADAIYHLAARFGFGLEIESTRVANVYAPERLLELAAAGEGLRRFVYISGYRTTGTPAKGLNIDDESNLMAYYREHGAYEGSKMEAHERVRRRAQRLGVPLTRISPATVIGDSRTGETTQSTGLAETLEALWLGKLPALAGTRDTWLPVVPVDFFASLLAGLPDDPESDGGHYVVFDDRTPTLPKLMDLAANRMGVTAPRTILPVSFLRVLPSALTGVDSEALSFISDDRYDPVPLRELSARLGLKMPPLEQSLERWIDYLMDTRFGKRPQRSGKNVLAAGTRVFARGERDGAEVILLHGVMLNEHTWTPVTEHLKRPFLAPDLPGFGRSAAGGGTPAEWMNGLLSTLGKRPLLVGHSLGSAFALDYACAHPERVSGLVIVSPFFLQARPGWAVRQPWLMSRAFRWLSPERLAKELGGALDDPRADALNLLARPGVAQVNARWLAHVARKDTREHYRTLLKELKVPVTLIVGEEDPLLEGVELPPHAEVIHLAGAGHYPQLTHAESVARVIEGLG